MSGGQRRGGSACGWGVWQGSIAWVAWRGAFTSGDLLRWAADQLGDVGWCEVDVWVWQVAVASNSQYVCMMA